MGRAGLPVNIMLPHVNAAIGLMSSGINLRDVVRTSRIIRQYMGNTVHHFECLCPPCFNPGPCFVALHRVRVFQIEGSLLTPVPCALIAVQSLTQERRHIIRPIQHVGIDHVKSERPEEVHSFPVLCPTRPPVPLSCTV